MTPDAKLDALFAAARPPARDYAFEAVVARRVARLRAVGAVAALTPWAVAAAAVLWAVGPALQPMLDGIGPAVAPAGAVVTCGVIIAAMAVWVSGRFSQA